MQKLMTTCPHCDHSFEVHQRNRDRASEVAKQRIEAYKQLGSVRATAEKFGVAESSMSRYLKSKGIAIVRRRPLGISSVTDEQVADRVLAISAARGNISQAAKMLGMSRQALHSWYWRNISRLRDEYFDAQ